MNTPTQDEQLRALALQAIQCFVKIIDKQRDQPAELLGDAIRRILTNEIKMDQPERDALLGSAIAELTLRAASTPTTP